MSFIEVSWSKVVNEFCNRYTKVFSNGTVKAHLDVSGIVVDGAKDYWKELIMFDCIVMCALDKPRSNKDCQRRKFDQYAAFRDSVCVACGEAWVNASLRETNGVFGAPPESVVLVEVTSPWTSFKNLQDYFLNFTCNSKSLAKRSQAVTALFDSIVCLTMPLGNLLRTIVNNLYLQVEL